MKVAIIGAGMMGHKHGDAYQKLKPKAELAYIVETDAEKRAAYEKKYHCEGIPTLKELPSVDMIDICLPTFCHTSSALEALEHCNNIMLEKPACLTREEWARLCDAARKPEKRMMIGHVLRYWNGYVKAKELIDSGALGTIRHLTCIRQQKKPAWSKGNWLFQQEKSGGILFDLSIHDVDYVSWMLGKPKYVSCDITHDEDNITLFSSLLMEYDECSASVEAAWGMPNGFHNGQLHAMLEVVGNDGMVTYTGGDQLTLIRQEKHETLQLEAYDGYEKEIEYFLNCIEKQQQPVHANLDSVEDTMNVLWAATRAANEHRTISL